MRAAQVLHGAAERLRRPGAWAVVLLFGTVWNVLRFLAGPVYLSLGEMAFPFLLAIEVLGLSSLPWQWTGDERPEVPTWRGLAQALPWTVLLLVPLSLLLPGHGGRVQCTADFLPDLPPRMLVLLIAAAALNLLAGWILADRDREARRATEQAQLAREAQLRALQSQMSPHVLFNTLSGLAELAREDGAATESALVDLAGLLRRLLDHAGKDWVPLSEERALVEGFLHLERFRLGDRLQVRWCWDATLETAALPPLLLQPLVENALKHGIAPSREGGDVEIGLEGSPDRMRLWVSNSGRPLDAERPEGLGLGHLRRRIALVQGLRITLALRSEGPRTVAELLVEVSRA